MAKAIKVEIDEESFEDTKQKMFELYRIADSISNKMENAPVQVTEVVRVEEGDVLAVMVRGLHTPETLEQMKQKMSNLFLPKIVKVVILNIDAVELKVIRVE